LACLTAERGRGIKMVLEWCQNSVNNGVNNGARTVAGCLDHNSGFGLLSCGEGKRV
jgi:hypothetical protein